MDLLIQPRDDFAPILKAIHGAKTTVQIAIFRCDRKELEKALAAAVDRGVAVQALIAHTNRNGEKQLRDLEQRLLDAGVTVARTADDFVRYHYKFLVVDERILFLLAFNFTYLDVKHSRSFGLVTTNRQLVQEAGRLFDADAKRQPYAAACPAFVVSPANARRQIGSLIRNTRKELLIYDPAVSDPAMLRLLDERASAGVGIKILGRAARRNPNIQVRSLAPMRLHARAIVSDGKYAFIGSQSLRALELDARREAGVIFRDAKAVSALARTFNEDWEATGRAATQEAVEEGDPATKVAKKVAKVLVKELPPIAPVVDVVLKETVPGNDGIDLNKDELQENVAEAVKDAVKDAVRSVVEQAVEQKEEQ